MASCALKCKTKRHLLLMALCVSFLVTPLSAQEAVDPALQLYFSGNTVYNRKQYPIAVSIYSEFLRKYGTHEKAQLARYGLGLSQFALKQYDRAAPEFQKLVDERKLDPKIVRDKVMLLHAQCLLYANKKDEAQKRLLVAATTLKPGVYRTGAIAAMTDLYFSQSDWPNTIAWSKKLQAATPNLAQAIRAGYLDGYAL
jgi:tetratricopeptide (TPR) repeat protein